LPQPFARNPIGKPFIELNSVDSTNNYARSLLHEGLAAHGAAIFAREQVAGRGQRGKTWYAARDESLVLSVLLNPFPLPLSRQFQLSACVVVAGFHFLIKYAGSDISIKWPNDLYFQDRKTGGILIESMVRSNPDTPRSTDRGGSNWDWAIAGIGININQTHFPPDLPNPVSLKQITGSSFNAASLAKELCGYIEKYFDQLITEGFENIYADYVEHLYKKDQLVKLKIDNRIFQAVIRTVSPAGKLIVQHGIEEEFGFGEIEWV